MLILMVFWWHIKSQKWASNKMEHGNQHYVQKCWKFKVKLILQTKTVVIMQTTEHWSTVAAVSWHLYWCTEEETLKKAQGWKVDVGVQTPYLWFEVRLWLYVPQPLCLLMSLMIFTSTLWYDWFTQPQLLFHCCALHSDVQKILHEVCALPHQSYTLFHMIAGYRQILSFPICYSRSLFDSSSDESPKITGEFWSKTQLSLLKNWVLWQWCV